MKHTLIILLLVLFKHNASGQKTRKYAGFYSYGDTIPSGIIDIYPESDTTLLFDIHIINSNYHLGYTAGRIFIKHDSLIYNDTTQVNCKLLFQFGHKSLIVKTLEGHDDCGYGYGVYSDGVYKRTNNKIPQFFYTAEGDSIYFKDFNSKDKFNLTH